MPETDNLVHEVGTMQKLWYGTDVKRAKSSERNPELLLLIWNLNKITNIKASHKDLTRTTCKDNYSCNSFKVIDSANSDFEVSIKEALHIKHRNPNLNKQLSTQGMSFMLKIFT